MLLVTGGNGVVDPEVVMEAVWPKLRFQVSTNEHSADGIGKGDVTTFHRAILVGSISTSGTNVIAKMLAKLLHIRVVVQFTSLVKKNTFVAATRGMFLQEMPEPVDRGSLGDASVAMFHAGEVVGDEDPACFAIETQVVLFTGRVLGFLTSKGEINGKALVGFFSSAGGVGAGSLLSLFSTNTGGALVQDWVHVLELGDPFDMLVGIAQVVIAGMAKALMPEEAFGRSFDSSEGGVLVNVLMEVNVMKFIGDSSIWVQREDSSNSW